MGKTAVIIGMGQFPRKEYPHYLIDHADYIVCCDKAAEVYEKYALAHGSTRLPDAIIGDFDSISAKARKKYEDLIIALPEDQDTNDQTKAFNYVMDHCEGVSDIYFIGSTGKREDHTIGNISLLMEYARERDLDALDVKLCMVSDYSIIFPVTDSVDLDCGVGRRVSIFSPDNSLQICSKGLRWKTDDVHFDNWWKATLNVATEDTVSLKFSHKSIALVMMD